MEITIQIANEVSMLDFENDTKKIEWMKKRREELEGEKKNG